MTHKPVIDVPANITSNFYNCSKRSYLKVGTISVLHTFTLIKELM